MKLITAHQGVLHVQSVSQPGAGELTSGDLWGDFWLGVQSPTEECLASRGIHELLFDADGGHFPPIFPAAVLARRSMGGAVDAAGSWAQGDARALIWIDPSGTLYPPALVAAGISLGQLYLVRPPASALIETAVECLRCSRVGAVVATLPPRPSRVQVRRLQLAAERGGGVGIFLRTLGRGSSIYAAASRWLVAPAPGERTVQRWNIQLVHGQGRLLGQSFFLEKRRGSAQTNLVRPSAPLVDHAPISAAI